MDKNFDGDDDLIGILVIRGVGSAPTDASVKALSTHLSGYKLRKYQLREVNWSDSVLDTSDGAFASHLSAAWLNCLHVGWPKSKKEGAWQRSFREVLESTAYLLEIVPALCLLVFAAMYLRGLTGAPPLRIIEGCLGVVLSMPLVIALLSMRVSLVLCSFRAILLTVLWPVVSFIFSPARVRAPMMLCVILAASLSPIVVPELSFTHLNSEGVYDTTASYLIGYVAALIISMLLLLLAHLIYQAAFKVASPFLKIGADIFRYLGEDEYASALIAEVQAAIVDFDKARIRRIVLVTHSLGTVIAVDALRGFTQTFNFEQIDLFTAGSPLKRFFYRFFPGAYPAPIIFWHFLKCRMPGFIWVNIYRPFDEVGSCLSLPQGSEKSTCQFRFPSHPNYWGDSFVHRIARIVHRSSKRISAKNSNWTLSIEDKQRLSTVIRKRCRNARLVNFLVLRTLVFLVPLLPITRFFVGDLAHSEVNRRALLEKGQAVSGKLFQLKIRKPGTGETPSIVSAQYAVKFIFGGKTYSLAPDPSLVRNNALASFFNGSTRIEGYPLSPFIPTFAAPAQIVILTSDPRIFTVIGAQRGPWPWWFWPLVVANTINWGILASFICREIFDAGLAPSLSTLFGIVPPVKRTAANITKVFVGFVISDVWGEPEIEDSRLTFTGCYWCLSSVFLIFSYVMAMN